MDTSRLSCVYYFIAISWCSLGGGTAFNRTVRQVSCKGSQFRCAEGGCINRFDVCNGLGQCADNSDESPETCGCGIAEVAGRQSGSAQSVQDALPGSQPWHVGVYRARPGNSQPSLLCSGALIYDHIVLTSASCLFDPEANTVYSTATIRISAGKVKSDFNDGESFQQKFEVKKIIVMEGYEGDIKNFIKNLAIIKLKQNAKKSNFVCPACLWTDRSFPPGYRNGAVSGWGLQSINNNPLMLRESLINLMDVKECLGQFHNPLYKRFINSDKFCFTFNQGTCLREENTGGPVTISYEGRFYLVGIISTQVPNCNLTLATKISKHLKWIQQTVYQLTEADTCLEGDHFICNSNSKCIMKDKLCDNTMDCEDGSDEDSTLCSKSPTDENGARCQIPEGSEVFNVLKCGDSRGCKSKYSVPSYSKYQITCPEGRGFAKLGTEAVQAVCTDGEWIPPLSESKCLKLCPGLEFKSLDLSCQYMGTLVKCNEPMRPDTLIRVNCKRQFKKKILVNYAALTTCKRDGSLQHDISSECIPVCGKPYDNQAQTLISKGEKVKYAKYPWHVGLYRKIMNNETEIDFLYECGGTLIDTNKVLTAGHCVWEPGRHSPRDPTVMAVALGKYYSDWWSEEDSLAKKYEVDKVILGKHYNGASTKYSQDIAVLILDKEVEMTDYIMPACLDLNKLAGGIPGNQPGHIVGWGRLEESNPEPSIELVETWMDYLDLDGCRKKFDKYSFNEYLQSDKFCVVYKDGSGTQAGDSGGGLTFVHDELHYVYGVVSIKKRGQDEFAAFTNVLSHTVWLQDILKHY